MESGSAGLVSQVRTLMGLWAARGVLVMFILMVLGIGSVFLANGIIDLVVKLGGSSPALGSVGAVVVPLSVSLGFILLSFASLVALWRFASNDALERRVAALEERMARVERVLGLDDSDSPFG